MDHYPETGQYQFQLTHGAFSKKYMEPRPDDKALAESLMDLQGTQMKLQTLMDFLYMLLLRMNQGPSGDGLPTNSKALLLTTKMANTWDKLARLNANIGNREWLDHRRDKPFLDHLDEETLEQFQFKSAVVAAMSLNACKRAYEWLSSRPTIWDHDGEPVEAVNVTGVVFNNAAYRLKTHSYWLTAFDSRSEFERNMDLLAKMEAEGKLINVEEVKQPVDQSA